jgi:general secretion pathway protein J
MSKRRQQIRTAGGFTLIEALTSVALMGVILSILATITGQWLPSWNRGFVRVQRNELIDVTLDRLAADLSAAEFVTPNRDAKGPLFEGRELSVTFVRSALGPNSKPGLQVVRIGETADRTGSVLVRSTAPFVPSGPTPLFNFVNPAPLLRAPYRVTFAYAGRDGTWQNVWLNEISLPTAVRLVVRDAATERILAVSTAAAVHVDLPAMCVRPQDNPDCAKLGVASTTDADRAPSQNPRQVRESGG